MNERSMAQFKLMCEKYLYTIGISPLRAYGRSIGVAKSTTLSKDDLIKKIVAILAEEELPETLSNRGAPLKNDFIAPAIIERIAQIKQAYSPKYEPVAYGALEEFMAANPVIEFRAEGQAQFEAQEQFTKAVHVGQLQTFDGYSMLLPLNCIDNGVKVIVPIDLIRLHDLREGDVISCHANHGSKAYVACEILTINEESTKDFKRPKDGQDGVVYPKDKLCFCNNPITDSMLARYIDWILPLYKGQRSLILGAPKVGKTILLFELLKILNQGRRDVIPFVLLNEQAPENIRRFREYCPEDRLVYSTYEDEPERQVFVADFILKRAKRYAESGQAVILLVDSLNALARAFNDTEESAGGKVLAGGLESKTLQYLKKYFGAAHAYENGGSVTIMATLSTDTGNPADDLIAADLCPLAGHEVHLSEALALQRQYPAIDLSSSRVSGDFTQVSQEEKVRDLLSAKFIPIHGEQALRRWLYDLDTPTAFLQKIQALTK